MNSQMVIEILNGIGLVLLAVGGVVAFLGFKERICQLGGTLIDLREAHTRSTEAVNARIKQFQDLLQEQRAIRDEFIVDLGKHQEIFRHWLDNDLDVLRKRAERLRAELNRCESTCDRLSQENRSLNEKNHALDVQLEKERLVRASIEQLIQARAEESTSHPILPA